MGKNAITYAFIERGGDTPTTPYIADSGKDYDVLSRASVNNVLTADRLATIINTAGGRIIPDGDPRPRCQNKAKDSWFDPRFIEWSYTTGEGPDLRNLKTRIAFTGRTDVLEVAAAGRAEITAGGGKTNCINLIGEDFLNVVYDKVTADDIVPVTSPRFAPFIWSGSFLYESDADEDYLLPFKIATDIADQAPSIFGPSMTFTPATGLGRCRPRGKKIPRHLTVTTGLETGEKQKSMLPIQSDDTEAISGLQTTFSNLPNTLCLRYTGETFYNLQTLL
jgi:hypothetical protein